MMTKLNELSSMGATMNTVNIHEAKTQLSKLVEEASKGRPPLLPRQVKVIPPNAPTGG